MFAVEVREHIMIAHSFRGALFGPAQALHGATFVVDAAFIAERLDSNGVVVDIGRAHEALKAFLAPLNYRNLDDVPAFATKDGSEIRELLAHRNSCIRQQSLAEARVAPGASTTPHYHPLTEEIYYILAGTGRMTLDGESHDVGPGDAIAIPPRAIHTITCTSAEELRFLCTCAPGYEHSDTVLVE